MSSTPFPSLGPPLWPVRLLDVGLWLIGAGLLLCLICGPSHRLGLANFRVALLLLAGGLLLLLAGTLLAIVGMLVASSRRLRFARGLAMVAIATGLLASGYLLSWIARARHRRYTKSAPISPIRRRSWRLRRCGATLMRSTLPNTCRG